ncbi:hypothetical protein N7526_009585 [Penicillium atrosanguineum]|nr:hypothetical protein N7526_009585 [Penicillium atrosanguineum]
MYGTPHSTTMNGMGGEVIDSFGTIDPANLSNSGTYHRAVLASVAFVVSRSAACFYRRDRSIARTPRDRSSATVGCLVPSPLAYVLSFFLSPSFKLMPLLVSVMPAPSPAEPSPRGVKRSRTPDHGGNGQTEGDQDDGTCAWERILS